MTGQLKLLDVKIGNTTISARPADITAEVPITYSVLCPNCNVTFNFSVYDILYKDNEDVGNIECASGKCVKLVNKKVPIIYIKRENKIKSVVSSYTELFIEPQQILKLDDIELI